MSARTPATSADGATPARRLAHDVRAALDLLRRGQREAAEAAKGQPPDISLLLVADLALVVRDLEGLGK